jgi:excisionase family DNA binding protein
MSSNIRIEKTCEYCKSVYIAKTIKTRYCSHSCNNKAYKEAARSEKIKSATNTSSQTTPQKLITAFVNYDALSKKELLTIAEACLLLNITSVTLRRWIKEGVIKTNRIGKKHIITRREIDETLLK